jgi:phospholipid-binding lipoprotein MlaA
MPVVSFPVRRAGPFWRHRALGLAAALAGALGCAGTAPSEAGRATEEPAASAAPTEPASDAALLASLEHEPNDPLEPVNRGFFRVNEAIDWAVLDPISNAYRFVVPAQARVALRRAFDNLNSVSVLANDVLQCEPHDAIVTVFRFAINSTIGVAGFFDPASRLGLPEHESDFGETLYTYGMPGGPYLVLPLFGPSTARDAVGSGVDGFLRPQFWVLGPAERLFYDATAGISYRESNLDEINALRDSSLDYYTSLRGAYLMHREGELERRKRESKLSSRSMYEAAAERAVAPVAPPAPVAPVAAPSAPAGP